MPRTLTPESLVAVLRLGGKVRCLANYSGSPRVIIPQHGGGFAVIHPDYPNTNRTIFKDATELARSGYYYNFKLCPEQDNNEPCHE